MKADEDMEESMKVGLSREDSLCRSKWIVYVNLIVLFGGESCHPMSLSETLPDCEHRSLL